MRTDNDPFANQQAVLNVQRDQIAPTWEDGLGHAADT